MTYLLPALQSILECPCKNKALEILIYLLIAFFLKFIAFSSVAEGKKKTQPKAAEANAWTSSRAVVEEVLVQGIKLLFYQPPSAFWRCYFPSFYPICTLMIDHFNSFHEHLTSQYNTILKISKSLLLKQVIGD